MDLTHVLLRDDMQQDGRDKGEEAHNSTHEVHHRGTTQFTALLHDDRLGCHSSQTGGDREHLHSLHARGQGAIVHAKGSITWRWSTAAAVESLAVPGDGIFNYLMNCQHMG